MLRRGKTVCRTKSRYVCAQGRYRLFSTEKPCPQCAQVPKETYLLHTRYMYRAFEHIEEKKSIPLENSPAIGIQCVHVRSARLYRLLFPPQKVLMTTH